MKICLRSVRYIKEVEALPDLKDIRLMAQFINTDAETLQYALYLKNETYTIDFAIEEIARVHNLLDEKFKAAGVKPPVVKGTVQNYWG